ncbi:MAG: ATP-binding cassette domain-containing protein [Oscillospiraceae bacterium]|jgi:NitT/TauT family transport system ATP-binding protein|nr:ATP-binding cassette domain-containing protein [Oscillospiraceae bacterium]
MIELTGVGKSFGTQSVLRNLQLRLPERGLVQVRGASGSGKTTLLRILAGLETPDTGTLTGLTGLRVAYVFQEDRLLPGVSALTNVAIAADKVAARHWLAHFGLGDALDKRPATLSGGMRRRVALARAFAFAALDEAHTLLILDEPYTGLDADNAAVLTQEILRVAQTALVLLTHHGGDVFPPDAVVDLSRS